MKLLKASALMAVLLTCAVLMLGVLSLRVHPVRGGGGGAVPSTSLNGDLNCDGTRNITDAVVLLQYLFRAGPEPCAVAQEDGVLEKLNALGDQINALQSTVASRGPWSPRAENVISMVKEGNDSDAGVEAYEVPEGKTFVLTNLTEEIGTAPGNGSTDSDSRRTS